MHITNISLSEWQQFQKIDIELHDQITIFTGGNGSGKTTILNILAKHCGWSSFSLATPIAEKISGIIKYFPRLFRGRDKSDNSLIGHIKYSNNTSAQLSTPNSNAPEYQIAIQGQQSVQCFFIPSHRSIFKYQAIANIPTTKKNKQAAFQEISNNNQQRYQGAGGQSNSFFMKNTLIGWVIQGYGVRSDTKTVMPADKEQIQFFEGFQKVLKKILPQEIGFQEIEIRNMEVVFICNNGDDEFLLETTSGGISALIDIAWQIYMFSTKENIGFTVIIDEVENHLHPTMQRRILPDLVNAFPDVKFIVSTHSPLVVGSVKNSKVYALKYNEEGKVVSHHLDLANEAKNALEILDEVLGVSFTMPIWVEEKLNAIIDQYSANIENPEIFADMRKALAEVGLERLLPTAIENVLEENT